MSQRHLNEDTSDLNEEKADILEKVKEFFQNVVRLKVDLKSCKLCFFVCLCVCVCSFYR